MHNQVNRAIFIEKPDLGAETGERMIGVAKISRCRSDTEAANRDPIRKAPEFGRGPRSEIDQVLIRCDIAKFGPNSSEQPPRAAKSYKARPRAVVGDWASPCSRS